MHEWPIIHDERCSAREVQFTDERAMIRLADGRIIGVPLSWFPLIQGATERQRRNYISYGSSVYWHDVDDGIDITAMLSGLYIVPVSQRKERPKPHLATTWLYQEDGLIHTGGKSNIPFVHDTRNIPQAMRVAGDHLVFDLSDGRILCLPSNFSSRLKQASDSQRQNYHLDGLTIRWEQLGESINLIAMLTGFYDLDKLDADDAIETAAAPT